MGVLYYLRRDDARPERFALNKGSVVNLDILHEGFRTPTPLSAIVRTTEEFVAAFADVKMERAWAYRWAERMFRWAGDSSLTIVSDNDEVSAEDPITGSIYDQDYDANGLYIPESAW